MTDVLSQHNFFSDAPKIKCLYHGELRKQYCFHTNPVSGRLTEIPSGRVPAGYRPHPNKPKPKPGPEPQPQPGTGGGTDVGAIIGGIIGGGAGLGAATYGGYRAYQAGRGGYRRLRYEEPDGDIEMGGAPTEQTPSEFQQQGGEAVRSGDGDIMTSADRGAPDNLGNIGNNEEYPDSEMSNFVGENQPLTGGGDIEMSQTPFEESTYNFPEEGGFGLRSRIPRRFPGSELEDCL